MHRPIVIVPYQPEWPTQADQERAHIQEAIGQHLVRLEHIGSTSVPSLAAKPIIDLMAGIDSLSNDSPCIEALTALGYEYVPAYEDVMPYRRFFRKNRGEIRTHNLHMVEVATEFWERHLLFRDYLRLHPDAVAQYALLKHQLAAKHQTDLDRYTEDKTAFIREIEQKARAALSC